MAIFGNFCPKILVSIVTPVATISHVAGESR